jgi:hypothetical protein
MRLVDVVSKQAAQKPDTARQGTFRYSDIAPDRAQEFFL